MEDKNELSDIILEKEDNKTLKLKRILIIAALLILIFLVALVVMKFVNNPTPQSQNTKLILPPEPNIEKTVPEKEDNFFKQVPIEQEAKQESFEDMVKSLKEKEIKKQEEITPPVGNETKQVIEEIKKTEIPQDVVQEILAPKVTQAPKSETIVTTQNKATTATAGVYIQVGATAKLTPDKKFLATISSKNYEYRLLPIDVKGQKVTKILVGPYANTNAAKNVLADIKTHINKDAFIYRVK